MRCSLRVILLARARSLGCSVLVLGLPISKLIAKLPPEPPDRRGYGCQGSDCDERACRQPVDMHPMQPCQDDSTGAAQDERWLFPQLQDGRGCGC
jgi:hypothetical protein